MPEARRSLAWSAVAGMLLASGVGGCDCGWDPKPQPDPAVENQRRCETLLSSKSYRGVDLRGCDLSHQNFDGRDFERAQLANAVIEHSTFRHARFVEADLHDVDATGVDFSGSDFTRANMRDFGASGSQFRDCVMVEVDLEEGGFGGTTLDGTSFRHATLRGVQMGQVGLSDVRFDGADLFGAVFSSSPGGSWLGARCPDGAISTVPSPEFCSEHQLPRRSPGKLKSSRSGH